MKFKIIFLSILFSLQLFSAQCQYYSDTIQIIHNYGLRFARDGKNLKPGHLLAIVKANPEAYRLMKKAKDRRDSGLILGNVGGFIVGYTLGRSLGQGTLDKKTFILGSALTVLSIPFSLSYGPNAIKAVRKYNQGLSATQTEGAFLEFQSGENWVGLKLSF